MNKLLQIDSPLAIDLGYTSDRFTGKIWLKRNVIIISVIMSLEPRKGNFRRLLDTIEDKGFQLLVLQPTEDMEAICRKRGMEKFLTVREAPKRNLAMMGRPILDDIHFE